MDELADVEGQATWLEMIAVLREAASRGLGATTSDPLQHSQALGALLVASSAIALLPDDVVRTAHVSLSPSLAGLDQSALIHLAEQISRRRPIEALPRGGSAVIVALGDLIGEAAAA